MQEINYLKNFRHVEQLKRLKADFVAIFSNYSMTIEIEGEKIKYLKDLKSNRFFAVSNRLKKEIEENPKAQEIKKHEFLRHKTNYFKTPQSIEPFYSDQCICIDVNAAYPNVLRAKGLISQKMFKELMSLKKTERLACIGALASKKHIVYYSKGKVIDTQVNENEFSYIFKFCVNTIDTLMLQCMELNERNFIFYWVDGFYLKDYPSAIELKYYELAFQSLGLEFKVENLTQFELSRHDELIRISYLKGGKEKNFCFPDNSFQKTKSLFLKSLNIN